MTKSPQIILSHAGKQHSYYVARALNNLEALKSFYTSSYVRPAYIQRILEKSGDTFFNRRYIKELPGHRVKSNWRFEWKELLYARIFGHSGKVNRAVMERDVRFDNFIAQKLKKISADIFWGFQGSCFSSLLSAKKSGMKTIVELATAHYPYFYDVLEEEKALHPEWAESIVYSNFPDAYLKRLKEEPEVADIVIGASEFTLKTLRMAGIEEKKLKLLPLGFDVSGIPFEKKMESDKRPLRVLFAGRISQMKGVKYLLEAVKEFSNKEVELHLIGFKQGSDKALEQYNGHFKWHPAVSQNEMFQMYKEFDMLALPSIFEGFGLVIVEAMAAGLPVIATEHTIGPEIIIEGENGYIVPIRDERAIQQSFLKILSLTPEERYNMCLSARESALKFSWDAYEKRLDHFLKNV